ncbi:nicotinate-nucleotide--dimethylbenzimidazole phosphoribosyltransferase [Pseudomonas sp. OIL-1]|uniref:nicotinate-nucleotide--dimethylbenzimidazole phosphoribosyltransferase n=1 Tax=Pseudomonas sp. OIL-1 TaxID=2706126 RepID=UPI0013A71EF4|nr:nicotinate-nucleotide--dimethylbenzimidazole phosphoribosyltransferase [Pseudomonas sp. OIL-1]QIB49990.1 nicotinate-nucleotide--dimethylbenzimidazole phosphoribosyltransferase [Pseudomonas sp. OIL-1]
MNEAWWQRAAQNVNVQVQQQSLARQSQLTKPPGSLGVLEDLAVTLASLQRRSRPVIDYLCIDIFAGDHGVVEEGVSAFPQAVTGQMLHNFAGGGAAIAVLSRALDAQLRVYDLGLAQPITPPPGVIQRHIAPGTANFTRRAAMTAAQCQQALNAGRDALVEAAIGGCCDLYIAGEMGIGNTTSACALASALLGVAPQQLVGAGTGLDAAGVAHKLKVIERGLQLHAAQLADPLDALTCLGGLEIAALVGAYIAASQYGVPVLVDGYICSVAALCAVRVNPSCRPWLLFAHRSAEPGHDAVLAALDARPLLDLGMRLGEASGAAIAVPLLRLACNLHNEMATFAGAAVCAGIGE